MKRLLDFAAALLGLLLLALPLTLIALAIYFEDRRSPFFFGPRVGLRCREFRMIKFRTMTPDAWKSGVNSTAAGDRRITRVGRWLRQAKLDELPQLWNVLTGDMSLVGPRPQVAAEVNLYTVEECRMLDVRPGITDLASIVFADEGQILAGAPDPDLLYNQIIRPWKSRLALACVDHGSSFVDARIIGLTLLSPLSRRHALRGVEKLLTTWNCDALLRRMAARNEPLQAWPPPTGVSRGAGDRFLSPAIRAEP
jgi:lipopolysaccharide/colanic/teichoic acid biosynthesis glycosyltransferase